PRDLPRLQLDCSIYHFTPSLYSIKVLGHSHLYSFFYKDTATTEIYTLSLHDALPIYKEDLKELTKLEYSLDKRIGTGMSTLNWTDRKSTRLNSSHVSISYAVFCLKKKTERRKDIKY